MSLQNASSPTSSVAPPALELDRRRWTALFALPYSVVLAVGAVFAYQWLPMVLGARPGKIIGSIAALVCAAFAFTLARSAWRALTDAGPALRIDAQGITDRFHLNTHVPWTAIRNATLGYGDGDRLTLTLRPGARLADGQVFRSTWGGAARRLLDGGDLSIPLGGLVYQHGQLRDTLAAHLAHARRSRPLGAA